jgi:hypothetical protein
VSLPEAISPETFAKRMGWAPKRVRRLAKRLGACRVLGNRMMLLPQDIDIILEATKPCPLKSSAAARSGTTAGPLPAIDYAARRAQRTKDSHSALRPRSKPENTNVISMDRRKS